MDRCSVTFLGPLLAALPNLLLRISLAHDGILFAVHACGNISTFLTLVSEDDGSHRGLASSHFFLRFRQVRQPVLERPLVILLAAATTGVTGCFLGLPRGLFTLGGSGAELWAAAGIGVKGASLRSSMQMSSSSRGSSLGTMRMSSEPCSQAMSCWPSSSPWSWVRWSLVTKAMVQAG